MHDQPKPTEEEQEQGPERQQEEDAMRYPGHEDETAGNPDPDSAPDDA
jgi:hypothetical protein